ncbi:class III lanthionine synthetase LanKC N-terminal domain-containing protein [Yinghuangia aomiensis]
MPEGTLVERVRAALDRYEASTWDLRVDDLWCTATPIGAELPKQGWKIHVSSATDGAAEVLDRVCDVLVPRRVAFKCAAGSEFLRMLNSREAERSSSAKFITVYPHDDMDFVDLVDALDAATRGLSGPGVMSDRACRPGSIVHYRYGGFTERARLGNDGAYRPVLTAPDGSQVVDSREAWFTPPAWAPDPLADRHARQQGASGPGGVLIADRFAVTAAIRHSTKGGVFVGTDTRDGGEVVVKQARAHVEIDHSGRDAREALRHESALLERLAHTGLTPRHVALVEQDGTLFLAQERVPGVSLRAWVLQHAGSDGGDGSGTPDVPWPLARNVAAELVRVVASMHREGLVVRDLAPTNVMVAPSGELRLVDLELAADIGSFAGAAGTPATVPRSSAPPRAPSTPAASTRWPPRPTSTVSARCSSCSPPAPTPDCRTTCPNPTTSSGRRPNASGPGWTWPRAAAAPPGCSPPRSAGCCATSRSRAGAWTRYARTSTPSSGAAGRPRSRPGPRHRPPAPVACRTLRRRARRPGPRRPAARRRPRAPRRDRGPGPRGHRLAGHPGRRGDGSVRCAVRRGRRARRPRPCGRHPDPRRTRRPGRHRRRRGRLGPRTRRPGTGAAARPALRPRGHRGRCAKRVRAWATRNSWHTPTSWPCRCRPAGRTRTSATVPRAPDSRSCASGTRHTTTGSGSAWWRAPTACSRPPASTAT